MQVVARTATIPCRTVDLRGIDPEAGIAARHVDLHGAGSLDDGMARIGAAHRRLTDAGAWLDGFGWDVDRGAPERASSGQSAEPAADDHDVWSR